MAMDESSHACRTLISRHTTGMTSVAKFMKRWRQRSTVDCLCCYMLKGAAHVWVCYGPGVRDFWNASLNPLARWMDSVDKDQDLSKAILRFLHLWWTITNLGSRHPFSLRDAIHKKDSIEWNLLLE